MAGKARLDPQALHLAHAGLERPQRHAADEVARDPRDQEAARGRGVAPGQLRELALEPLKTEVDAELVGIGADQAPDLREVLRAGLVEAAVGQQTGTHGGSPVSRR